MSENKLQKSKRARNLSLFVLLVLALACWGLHALSRSLSDSSVSSDSSSGPSTRSTAAPITFSAIRLNGRGDDVVSLEKPDVPAILHLTHQGSSNFVVINYDANGETIDLLVNEIGRYDGVRPLDFAVGESTDRLEIQADGSWTAVVEPVTAAKSVAVPNSGYDGRGDAVLRLTGSDPDTATFSHGGDSNFVVQAYGNTRHLLVNEIGDYNGTVIVPRDTVVLEVIADGRWHMVVTGR